MNWERVWAVVYAVVTVAALMLLMFDRELAALAGN